MSFLACADLRYDAAARIAALADVAHEAHGQARRRPTEEQIRGAVTKILDRCLDPAWRNCAAAAREQLDEVEACSLALGFRD